MKRIIIVSLQLLLVTAFVAGCKNNDNAGTNGQVDSASASPAPMDMPNSNNGNANSNNMDTSINSRTGADTATDRNRQ